MWMTRLFSILFWYQILLFWRINEFWTITEANFIRWESVWTFMNASWYSTGNLYHHSCRTLQTVFIAYNRIFSFTLICINTILLHWHQNLVLSAVAMRHVTTPVWFAFLKTKTSIRTYHTVSARRYAAHIILWDQIIATAAYAWAGRLFNTSIYSAIWYTNKHVKWWYKKRHHEVTDWTTAIPRA